jgi:hypothetical protein
VTVRARRGVAFRQVIGGAAVLGGEEYDVLSVSVNEQVV